MNIAQKAKNDMESHTLIDIMFIIGQGATLITIGICIGLIIGNIAERRRATQVSHTPDFRHIDQKDIPDVFNPKYDGPTSTRAKP